MLRLARDGVSAREIGRTLGLARSTVQDNLARASAAGLAWPIAEEIADAVLEQRLFDRSGAVAWATPSLQARQAELRRHFVRMSAPTVSSATTM